ncbi:MAG: NAD(P)H-hydrate dehydratase [Halobacteriales archaeon]
MITARRMAAVDRNAAALGVSQRQLMEASGRAVADAVRDLAGPDGPVAIVAGRGNNGGDAFVTARVLDADVAVHLLGRPTTIATEAARANWDALTAAEADVRVVRDSRDLDLGEPDVVVDAILGTGITGVPREPEASAIEAVNAAGAAGATVVSVDVPSGLDADTGEAAGPVVDSDRVVTFHDLKPGLADRDAVVVADIGIPAAAERFTGPGDLLGLDRPSESHKGDFGHVLVVGGGPYTGAPALAALAALRAGGDLATVATPEAAAPAVQSFGPDLIVRSLAGEQLEPAHVDDVLALADERDALLLGPGLGDAAATREAVAGVLAGYDGRAVVDADALQVVPEVDTDATLVCTPHQGELRAMGGPRDDDWRERADAVGAYAADLGHTLLVKGAYDVISDGATTRINRTGNPGMTVGGTGDVLAGATGALLCRLEPVDAAAVGAFANGTAGDRVAASQGAGGLLASDLLDELPGALREATYD